MGTDDAGATVNAYDASFGLTFVGSFPKDEGQGEECGLVHICMVVGQHFQKTRRVRARCGRANLRAVVRVVPTCFACIARVYEKHLPL